ncbi:hypothetical protein LTR97_009292 [Elasticomyces elasticus]|uniref:Uncharacterized protein n=1 Tax=Elasticomyces elasticus TaxID=574655 RepID=A0AAN7W3D3_9PEZI|nr:hypothetical protein LTR97_009292 [Elasticomyces elasticus]KAK5728445.1 hypothetical protein LTR15_001581 [Elasticomyces elasticus]
MASTTTDTSDAGGIAIESEHNGDREHKIFRLLDLPPELWIAICRLAVTFPDPVVIANGKGFLWENIRQPAITHSCSMIRKETIAIFQANHFVCDDSMSNMGLDVISRLKIMNQKPSFTNLVIESSFPGAINFFNAHLKGAGLQVIESVANRESSVHPGRMVTVLRVITMANIKAQ